MLSILVPVYNYDVRKMVQKLYKQCKKLDVGFEILVYDDLSKQKYKDKNNELGAMFGVNYLELSENLGRSRIRNWLVKSARYDYVLFLDCDSKIVSNSFVKDYIESKDVADIINGGTVYSKKPPRAKSKYLHWYYGTHREAKRLSSRKKHPITHFHSNNFLGKRKVLEQIPFDESLDGYGYEDLVLAQSIDEALFTVTHIDNPVEHLGINTNKIFLQKTEQAIQNLITFQQNGVLDKTRLQRFVTTLEEWSVDKLLKRWVDDRHEIYYDQLLNNQAKLWKLDLLKLYWYWSKR